MEEKDKNIEKNPALELKTKSFLPAKEFRHVYNSHCICTTNSKGFENPADVNPTEIRVDASEGFIPLWDKNVTLNWRFSKSFGSYFKNPEAAKNRIRNLLNEAIMAWENACPIQFNEVNYNWDFEIEMHSKNCDTSGCVLASSFFPGTGQNTFYIYPTMLEQSVKEQKETMIHELGHIFGLRHFFANISEKQWRSELFGTDSPFSIMNYGEKSELTKDDINDLKQLYSLVWNNKLNQINGTKIKKFVSYHMSK